MIVCKRASCTEPVVQKGVGRPPEYHSDACRAADRREREHTRLAVETGEALLSSPEHVAISALAGLPDSALLSLLDRLGARSRAS